MTAYVVYNLETTYLVKAKSGRTHFESKGAATRAKNEAERKEPEYGFGITDVKNFYNNIELTVTRYNALTGAPFEETVNTPYYCSPSSEHYHCS